ncbi:disease resistance protein RPV1-like [Rutidosis leptorrhynchoides]|uniref:disease resistance protein RPV1-like n=1 Tax=Rutidosis leptorrhynchoides TaxID=125765 RepID=UPI003A9984DE
MNKFVTSTSSNHFKLKPACRFDVFLSFRGSNTRKNFTDHLLKDLKQNGYHPFHDSILNQGEYIDSELLKAIEESRMSIVLFSKNYADSKWCLDELQLGFFAQAFKDHGWKFDHYRVEGWRKALEDAGKLSGLHLQNDANGYEAKLVSKIIKEVAKYLKRPSLNVAYHHVGIESRMTELIELLQMETNDVRIVVVWGSGGLGKTTIVKATFNYICSEFESSSFLEDVKDSGKSTSQNKLIWDLMTDKTPKIKNVPRATEEIRQIFMFQRVLVVLDDINKFEHLEMLAIDARFFCPGSRIIITTRVIASVGSLKINAVYSPEALNEYESLRLFSLYAFGNDDPHKGYEMLTTDVV